MEIVCDSITPTGRIRHEIVIIGSPTQLPPGIYEGYSKRVYWAKHDFNHLEERLAVVTDDAPPPTHAKPKKYKDVPFWCKRR